ncbi:acyl-CoA dehydrogenase family protein [Microbacterium sp. A93]|uniref:acyl-CoA dehydrogenase family protein n=1 Tax=Microbacterium sp. A93 TaxID=3450716 RepID=UPI003F43E4CD
MHALSSKALKEFRDEARTWLEENVPREPQPKDPVAGRAFDCAWQAKQYEGGWAGVAWPKEHGGRGLSPVEQIIWFEEMARANAPRMGAFTIALGHAGPTIIENGTVEQQQKYLEPILAGRTPWCQGFSEPDAGSDLASLRTSAVIDGDHLVVNGSKIWTSFALMADYQELLVRTDPALPRHKGLSWVVMDMKTEGLTVRPIRSLEGHAPLNQCTYDNVRIPLENVVGGLNNGWRVALSTLAYERGSGYLASRMLVLNEIDELIELARKKDRLEGTEFAYELATLRAEAQVIPALAYDGIADGRNSDLSAAVNQVYYGEVITRLYRVAVAVLEDEGLVANKWMSGYLAAYAFTIAGGTKDIQKNILGERVLGLPR